MKDLPLDILHVELDKSIDLSECGVEYAIAKLITILEAEGIYNPNASFVLECNLVRHGVAAQLLVTNDNIYQIRLVKYGHSDGWKVWWRDIGSRTDASNGTVYSVGTTPAPIQE